MNPGATPTVDHRGYPRLPADLIVSIRKRPVFAGHPHVRRDLSEGETQAVINRFLERQRETVEAT